MRSSRSKKKPAKKGPVQTRLVNDRGMLGLESSRKHQTNGRTGASFHQSRLHAFQTSLSADGKGTLRVAKKTQWTKSSSRLPIELCLLIAQVDPLVAIRLHAVNRWFRDLIRENVISMTQTRFLAGMEGITRYNSDWDIKICLRGLFCYFGGKMMPSDDNLDADVNLLKKHIKNRYSADIPKNVRAWIWSLQESKLITADARSYLMRVLKAARAYYGSLHLTLGDDDKGTNRFALSFLALAETVLGSQFKTSYRLKITCNTKFLFQM